MATTQKSPSEGKSSKRFRTQKKRMSQTRRLHGNLFVKIALIVFGIFILMSVFNMQSQVAMLKEEEAALTKQIAQYENKVEELQADMLTPFDDAYRIRVAREKLGYCFRDEIIYYNDISN